MADSDDGMILNLASYEPKKKKVKKQEPSADTAIHAKESTLSKGGGRNDNTNLRSLPKKKYIDDKDFTPISTLFNKNPEIPEIVLKESTQQQKSVVFSSESVSDMPVNERLRNNLRDNFKFSTMTVIQMLAIPPLLEGKDVLIKSPTGSGKTICYAVPIVQKLIESKPPVTRQDGPYALILVPTRELAQQTLDIVQELCKSCISIVPGMLIGGEKCKSEKARLRKGVNIIIATPGRLQYHLKETACLNVSKVSFLVLDEADKLLDMGFQKTISEIVKTIDERRSTASRQSVLLSATLTQDVDALASVSLNNHIYVDANKKEKENDEEHVIPSSLKQYFVTVPAKLRLITLLSFITNKAFTKKEKTIVFVSNKSSVCFHLEALKIFLRETEQTQHTKYEKSLHILHGDMSQTERFKNFDEFKKSNVGILICTDVAARGIDVKRVEWIVQYSCPTLVEDYMHRAGRSARVGVKGQSLLFIMPSEVEYLKVLNESGAALSEITYFSVLKEFASLNFKHKKQHHIEEKVTDLQNTLEVSFAKTKDLENVAIASYKAFIQAYATYPSALKSIFHVKNLHLGHLAKSFALREAPNKFSGQIVPGAAAMMKQKKMEKERQQKKSTKERKMLEMKDEIVTGPKTKKDQKIANLKKKKKATLKRKIRI